MIIKEIFQHRSVRKYKSDPIPDNILDNILLAGTRASNTGNMQAYSMIVTTDPSLKEKLWQIHFKQDMVLQAPVHITFCADFNRFSKWCRLSNAEPGFDNFLSFFNASIDALLASQNVVLEAEANGLGACYLGTAIYNGDLLSELLHLPELVVPVAAIVTGYPDESAELTDRLPVRSVIHHEVYNEFDNQTIEEVYSGREKSAQTAEFLRINNKKTLAQIYTDIRYKKEDNEHFSGKFLEVIKKQGFLKTL